MQHSAALVVALDDILAAADTFAVVDNAVAHVADTAVHIVAAAAVAAAPVGNSVVAHSTVVPDIAGTVAAVDFVDVYLRPCIPGSLLWTARTSAPLPSFQPPALLPQESPGV